MILIRDRVRRRDAMLSNSRFLNIRIVAITQQCVRLAFRAMTRDSRVESGLSARQGSPRAALSMP